MPSKKPEMDQGYKNNYIKPTKPGRFTRAGFTPGHGDFMNVFQPLDV